jgi:hypothetical protein
MAYRGRDWNEESLSESPAVRQLEGLGYSFVSAETLEAERESLKEAGLRDAHYSRYT